MISNSRGGGRRSGRSSPPPAAACRCANRSSQRATRPSGVSSRHCGQSISCRRASSWRTMSRSPARPNCTTRSSTASSPRGQAAAQLAVDQFVEERVGLRLVEHMEAGIEPGLDGVRPQQRAAEGMDRADPGRVQFADQAEPMIDLASGRVEQPPVAGGADAVAHLPCRPLGEGDGRQLVQRGGACSPLATVPGRRGIAR